jgi:radical SAM protein with 4Fe4S-binding SPASM domain
MFGDNGEGCSVCGILGILGVLGNGSYALCGIGATVPDLIFGHAARDRLRDVWEKTSILVELRDGLPGRLGGICGKCLMNARCLGTCIAQNYYRRKNIWTPFWYCEEAYSKELFPVSRARSET